MSEVEYILVPCNRVWRSLCFSFYPNSFNLLKTVTAVECKKVMVIQEETRNKFERKWSKLLFTERRSGLFGLLIGTQ